MRADFVIVGSGIAGLSASYMLAERGYKVYLVGLPELTSLVAGSSSGILTYHMREPFLSWALRTAEIYEGTGALELVESVWFTKDRELAQAVAERLSERGLRAGWSEEKARELIGDVNRFGEEVLVAEAFRLDVKALIDSFTRRAAEAGVSFVKGWGKLAKGGVVVGSERVEGEVIVANGAWAKESLDISGLSIYKCQAARLKSPRVEVMVIDDVLDYYINAARDGTTAVGDGANVVTEVPEDALWPDREMLIDVLKRPMRRGIMREHEVIRYVSAPCIGTNDSFPLVGELEEGLYLLTAFNGVGFSIAPALAELLVDHLDRGTPIPLQLDPKRELRPGAPVEPVD
ncbi:MAG: FAD-binding oxidoreductase [Acidilobaceae archaeon]|nr:FAD-binding oxidoreductase [Acidilobaceae archaeon]